MDRDRIADSVKQVVEAQDEMAKYGISRIPVYHFRYREFRYTDLESAVAQAKRDQSGE